MGFNEMTVDQLGASQKMSHDGQSLVIRVTYFLFS